MQTSSNYGFKLPEGADNVKRQDLVDNFGTIDTTMKAIDDKSIPFAIASGSANTYTATISGITSYTTGLRVCIQINIASTGASTLNINSLGAKTILDSLGNAITSGGLKANIPYQLCYNGTNFIVLGKGGGGTATASQMLSGATATVDSGQIIGIIPSKTAQTYTPSTLAQTIAALQYLSGIQTIAGDANLVTGNIKAGSTIFGVAGKSTVVDTSDALATAVQLLSGASAYVNGIKIAGTMANNGAVVITPGTSNQSIATGYHNGSGYVKGDSNLAAANIVSGISIFGIGGSATITSLGGLRVVTGTCTSFSLNASTGWYMNLSGIVNFTPKIVYGMAMSTRAFYSSTDTAIACSYSTASSSYTSSALGTFNTLTKISVYTSTTAPTSVTWIAIG